MIEQELTFKQIKNLKDNGFDVSILRSDNSYTKVLDVYEKYQPGFRLTFDDNTYIECAKNHRMLCDDFKWKTADELNKNDQLLGVNFEPSKKLIDKKSIDHDYWIDFTVDNDLEEYVQNNIIHHNSGKSYSLFLLSNFLLMNNQKEKILIIVPSVQLVSQLSKDFQEYAENWCDFSEFVHQIYSGQEKQTDKRIVISTYQSLNNCKKEYFEQFTSVCVDECHSVFRDSDSTKVITRILENCVNCSNRFGFSGSLQSTVANEKQLNGLFGDIERIVNAKELIDKGILAEFNIKCIVLDYKTDRKIELKNKFDNIRKDLKRLETAKYNTEITFIKELQERIDFITSFGNKIKKNTIFLFRSLDYGKKIYEELYKQKNKKVYYIDGSIPVSRREEIRENFEKYDNCLLIASFGTFSTGINIKQLYNVVFIENIKSHTKVVQSIGRVLRKLNNKNAKLYDIVDDLRLKRTKNYSYRHFEVRMRLYKNENHNYKVVRVKL